MKKILLSAVVVVLSSLACGQYVGTPTPLPSPIPTLTPPTVNTPTHVYTAVTQQPTASTSSVIVAAVVTVRNSPGGDPTGEYVKAGEAVEVLEVSGDWVRIGTDKWVWIGCVEGLSQKGCMAE